MEKDAPSKDDKLLIEIVFLNAKILGLIIGILLGTVVFVATNWLVLKGGHINEQGQYVVGPHLELLSQFFIGYRVSFIGSIIGFAYGFAVGTFMGGAIGWIYNKIIMLRGNRQ